MRKHQLQKVISSGYAELIDRDSVEKLKFWRGFLKSNKKRINVLEVGIGGGGTLRGIKRLCNNGEVLYAIDIEKKFVHIGKNIINNNSILANVCKLPFRNNFFQAINLSSVLHEVSSYGYMDKGKHVVGLKAVKIALSEVKRVLEENGLLYYRDILAPQKRTHKSVRYDSVSIKFFIDLFLDKFANTKPFFYRKKYKLKKENNSYIIYAENFLHREIQKHYLLCLENLSTYFINAANGKVNYKKTEKGFIILEKIFSKLVLEKNKELRRKAQQWLGREGGEKYLYFTGNELIKFGKINKDKKGYILAPVGQTREIRFINKKNLFIKKLIANAEEGGKQEIFFTKIKI